MPPKNRSSVILVKRVGNGPKVYDSTTRAVGLVEETTKRKKHRSEELALELVRETGVKMAEAHPPTEAELSDQLGASARPAGGLLENSMVI